jgi:probable HAF family extracellular repeat protein
MATSFSFQKALCIVSLISASSLQAQSLLTDLGMPAGATFSQAWGTSSDGSVIVGVADTGVGVNHAYGYSGGTWLDLGTLGGVNSIAAGVSSNGLVITGSSDIAGGARRAFSYTLGTGMVSLGVLAGGAGSYGSAVSGNGLVFVGASNTAAGNRAFAYAGLPGAGTMVNLGILAGGTWSWGNRVSYDGSVIVGEADIAGGNSRAFKYTGAPGSGTMVSLGTLGAGDFSSASGVSGNGLVVVGGSNLTVGGVNYYAFKYSGSTMTNLGTLGAGDDSWANAASYSGKVIVGESNLTVSGATKHAFTYIGSTMKDLGTLGGATSSATGVSSDGSVVVGYSETAGGATHAFVYRTDTTDAGGLVDVNNTYAALSNNSYQLNSLLNTQNTLLAVSLSSDCTVYGANNICVGVGGRYTNISSPSSSQTAGNIQVGYRFAPSLRAGVFLDQGINNATPSNYTVKNSQPLAGLFAVYAPTGNSLGPQVKVSGAYSSNGVNIARTTLANTEAGQGSSTMTTQGAQLESAYGFAVGDSWIASPLVGIKATQVSRNGYTETAGATFPVTYNAVNQSATTAYAGAKVFGYVMPKVSVGASAGLEQDVASNMDNYSGSIYYLGGFSMAAPAVQHTRAFVGANTDYWIEKNQRVSLGVYYNQQSLNTANGVTAMLNYTIGL